ncbi:MAG: N5-glutamine methyltransferase family protein, partial [Betaproteobacteria bacterium]
MNEAGSGQRAGEAWHAQALHRIASALQVLPDKPEETPEATLAALCHAAAGTPCSAATAPTLALPVLDEGGRARFEALLARRLGGEPLAHITGRQRFMDLEMLAGPEALIPRMETQILARTAIDALRAIMAARPAARPVVLDVCTGSGNLAAAIASHVRGARVFASDLSAAAVDLARRNAAFLGLGDAIELRTGDLLQPFEDAAFVGNVDLLVCNPPYISSARVDVLPAETGVHEPRLAFDGGPLGIRILSRLVAEAPRFLRPGGVLAFEVGLGQARGVQKRMAASGAYADVRAVADDAGEG